jgi:ABC-type polysaccharide/polyol phosphate export permease
MLAGSLRFSYFQAIWRCRHFWFSLVQLDLRTRYRRSILGLGWSLLNPVAMTAILCVVFHKLFGLSVTEYAPHVLCGLAIWNYITSSTMQGCHAFFQGESYIRQCSMPLAIFPLRTALGTTFHFLIALAVVVLLISGLGILGFRQVHLAAFVHIVPAAVMLFFVCWSLAILAGMANVYFQDTQHLLEVGFQMVFYATPIIYKANVLESYGLGWVLNYNPAVVFLKLIRDPILDGTAPSLTTYAHGLLILVITGGLATYFMSRAQKRLIFHL